MEENSYKEGYGGKYGKRPLWQWVLIYLVIGAIVYGVIYFVFFAKKGGYGGGSSSGTAPRSQNAPGY